MRSGGHGGGSWKWMLMVVVEVVVVDGVEVLAEEDDEDSRLPTCAEGRRQSCSAGAGKGHAGDALHACSAPRSAIVAIERALKRSKKIADDKARCFEEDR